MICSIISVHFRSNAKCMGRSYYKNSIDFLSDSMKLLYSGYWNDCMTCSTEINYEQNVIKQFQIRAGSR